MAAQEGDETRADAVVIGGGILGAATAYEMAKAGLTTVLFERGAANWEGSGATSGSICIQAIHPRRPGQKVAADSARFLPLQRAASDLWETVEQELETRLELRPSGGFMVAENEEQVAQLRAKHELELKARVRSEFLTAAQTRWRYRFFQIASSPQFIVPRMATPTR